LFDYCKKMEGFAIVTGSARGLGKAMAMELAREGYDIVVNHVSEGSAKAAGEVCAEAEREFGVKAVPVRADVSDYVQCESIIETGRKTFGSEVAVLVNNAGIQNGKPFAETPPERYRKMIETELIGTMNCTHLALPYMTDAKRGCIVNISSICFLTGEALQCDYDAAKGGIIGFTRGIAREYAPFGIRANCIAPGLIMTDMVRASPEAEVEAFRKRIPLGRLGTPDDIAQCMAYMVNAGYLTGQTISPNGGAAFI
jgi:3-oxoacyl-[acyl-carrier protein] reductase